MEWNPNKEILEDLLNRYRTLPDEDKDEPLFATDDGETYSPKSMIEDITNRTEEGRVIYESFLEMEYLRCKQDHSK